MQGLNLKGYLLEKNPHLVFVDITVLLQNMFQRFYPTALKGCRGIVFTHGVRMGGRAAGNSLSGLYLRNRKV